MSAAVSNKQLITTGTLWVNVPVMVLLFGGTAGAAGLLHLAYPAGSPGLDGIVAFAVAFVLAWLWWSVNLPKWRIWALERTGDWPALRVEAIKAGLIWDEATAAGRLFRSTEIRSAKDQRRISELEQAASAR